MKPLAPNSRRRSRAALRKPGEPAPRDPAALEYDELLAEVETLRGAQLEIEHSQQIYAELFDEAPVGYVNLTPLGRIERANAVTAELLSAKSRHLEGAYFTSFVQADDLATFTRHLRRCRDERGDQKISTELRVGRGRTSRHVELISRRSPLFGSTRIIYRTVILDITARKLAEAALRESEGRFRAIVDQTSVGVVHDITERRQAQAALAASREQMRLVMENAREYAIFSMDLDRRVTTWNVGARRLLGYTEEEILGRSGDVIFTAEDCEKGEPAHEAQQAVEQGRAIDERWHVRKDGTRFWGSGVMMPMHDEANENFGLVKIFRDQTEARQAAEALEESRQQLSKALEVALLARDEAEAAGQAKDHFLAVLSHELRTPLNPVMLATQMLMRRSDLPREVRDVLEMIRRNVQLETHLVNDLLDVTRIGRGKVEYSAEPYRLHEAIRRAVEVCTPDFQAKKQRIELVLRARRDACVGDFPRIQQVVWNLLKNASKFTPERGCIHIRTRSTADRVFVDVADTGIGIEPGALASIFEAFTQANRDITRQYGGLGLGLAIARATVAGHRGQLTVTSAGLGHGATFTVALPLAGAARRA